MSDESNKTIGAILTPEEQRDILVPFDEARERAGINSRAEAIKRAVRHYSMFLELVEDLREQEPGFWQMETPREEVWFIRSALLDRVRYERERSDDDG